MGVSISQPPLYDCKYLHLDGATTTGHDPATFWASLFLLFCPQLNFRPSFYVSILCPISNQGSILAKNNREYAMKNLKIKTMWTFFRGFFALSN